MSLVALLFAGASLVGSDGILHANYELGVAAGGQSWAIRSVHRAPEPLVQQLGPYRITATSQPEEPGLYTLSLQVERVSEVDGATATLVTERHSGAYGVPLEINVDEEGFVLSGAITIAATPR